MDVTKIWICENCVSGHTLVFLDLAAWPPAVERAFADTGLSVWNLTPSMDHQQSQSCENLSCRVQEQWEIFIKMRATGLLPSSLQFPLFFRGKAESSRRPSLWFISHISVERSHRSQRAAQAEGLRLSQARISKFSQGCGQCFEDFFKGSNKICDG